jgi:TM2 domain-containing membrane protein YozV
MSQQYPGSGPDPSGSDPTQPFPTYPPSPYVPQQEPATYQPYPPPPNTALQPYGQPPRPVPDYSSQPAPVYSGPVYAGPVYAYPQKSRMAAGLLGIFLGALGIHNFYLGRTGIAVIQLLVTLLSLGILATAVWIWALIEGIMILSGSASFRTDARGIPLRD